MRQLEIDHENQLAIEREALALRARRLDKPVQAVFEYAAKQARREMLEELMKRNERSW